MPSILEILGPISLQEKRGGSDLNGALGIVNDFLLSRHANVQQVFYQVTQANPEDRIKLLVIALQKAISEVLSGEDPQRGLTQVLITLYTLEFHLSPMMKLAAEDVIALAIPGISDSEKRALKSAIDNMKAPDGKYHRYPWLPKVNDFFSCYSAPKDSQLGAKLVELLETHRPWSCVALLRQEQTKASISSIFTAQVLQALAKAFHEGYLDPVGCSQMLAQLGKLIGEHTSECTLQFLSGFAQLAYDGHPEIYFSLLEQKKGDGASDKGGFAIPQEWQVALWTKDRVVVRVRGVNDPAYDYPALRLIAEKATSHHLKKAFAIIAQYPLKDQFAIFNGSSKSPEVLKQCKQLVKDNITNLLQSLGLGEDNPGGATIKARLEQMSFRGDKKKQAVLGAIDAIIRANKDPNGRLVEIKRALENKNSDLYKALNMKRWVGLTLWDQTTGSYKAIKAAFDDIQPSHSQAAAASRSFPQERP